MLFLRRKLLNLKQIDIYLDSGISERTIRDVEANRKRPSDKIIEKLSLSYKLSPVILSNITDKSVDFVELDYYFNLLQLNQVLEVPSFIDEYILDIKNMLVDTDQNSFKYLFLMQYLEFLYGLKLAYKKDYSLAITHFIKSITMTLNKFKLSDINSYLKYTSILSKLEIRNLFEIAICLNHLDNKEVSFSITKVFVDELNTRWTLYGDVLYQYSLNLISENKLHDSLNYMNKTILFSQTNHYYKNLPLYYLNRSIIKFKLGENSYMDDISISLSLTKALGLDSISQKNGY